MPKPIHLRPVTGIMDARGNPEDIPSTGYRRVENWAVESKSKLCRLPGWAKLLDRDVYENYDLHSQLESLTGLTGRRPITLIMECSSQSKSKTLVVGTDRALYALSVGTGNWRIISDKLGADGVTRWYGTMNLDTVIFTNDYDPPVYWPFDGAPVEANNQSVAVIPDLVTLGITRVGVVITFNNCSFLMNIVEKGVAKTADILWSDADNGLSYIPGQESVAGRVSLDSQESILNALPLAGVLMIYTTRGIWELSFNLGAGPDQPAFLVGKRYAPAKSGEACLAYKNSLISTGDEHIFMGSEGIYSYSVFVAKPVLVDWIHKSSAVIYDEIDRSKCDWQIGFYDSIRRNIWFSWVANGQTYPIRSLAINKEFPFASLVNHGFTAFGYFQPSEPVTTLKNWILDNCICDSEQLLDTFGEPVKEGGSCHDEVPVTCESQPDSFFTTVTQELEDGIVMEDWNEETATENSLCSRLEGTTISSLCVDEARRDQCNAGNRFVMASAEDFCLKEMSSEAFYRELCLGYKDSEGNDVRIIEGSTPLNACGTFETVGYKSILRSGPLSFGDYGNEKEITRFVVQAIAAAAMIPGRISMRFGVSSMPLDPNDASCGIVWYEEDPFTLDCVAVASATHAAEATRPDNEIDFPAYAIGKYLYYEITIDNPDSTPIDTGAQVCLSSFVVDVGVKKTRNP